jgi:hypothetical protein
MKKITLLVAITLVSFTTQASNLANRFNMNEPIQFNERGIEFFVFSNGEFDFNTQHDNSQGGYYYKTAGRRNIETNRMTNNYGVLIEHDNFGRVRRIGNTFINYDFNDRVSRIGTVFMRYNRFALTQIGGLQLVYNRYGELIDTFGSVKGRRNYGFSYVNNGCNNNYENNGNNNDYENQNNSNNSDYYYKQGNKTADSIQNLGRRNRR